MSGESSCRRGKSSEFFAIPVRESLSFSTFSGLLCFFTEHFDGDAENAEQSEDLDSDNDQEED